MPRSAVAITDLGPKALAQVRGKLAAELPRRSKYGNKRVGFKSVQGFQLVAASKAEAADYATLDLGIKTGLVTRWAPQVGFLLPGGSRYVADALVWWADGRVTVRDCKGVETPAFKLKRGLMKSTYGIEIEMVRA